MNPPLERRLERIDPLVEQLEAAADPASKAAAKELVQILMDLHRSGLERIIELMQQSGQAGEALLARLGRDTVTRSVLLLHGLHPVDVETRVREALQSHGDSVELLSIDGERSIHVRVVGPATLARTVEQAIRDAAPDLPSVVVERQEPLVMLERRR